MTYAYELSAREAADLIRRRQLTSLELVESCLDRIAAQEPVVGAWASIVPEIAISQAKACDASAELRGPLHGVPIGVKDVIDTRDYPTAYGARLYVNHRPAADAACVTAVRRAGAIILGKTTTAEFASISPPATRNPLNLAHTPGGSSSGSAAALADLMVPLALGTQTAGSTIRPSSFCGVIGFKPSYNLINRAGIKPSAESLDTVGLMGRNVDDVAFFFHAILNSAIADKSPKAPARVAICRTDLWAGADSWSQRSVETVAQRLAEAGVQVVPFPLSDSYSGFASLCRTILGYEAARALAWEYDQHPDQLSDLLRARIEEGMRISTSEHASALSRAMDARRQVDTVAGDFDLILTPAAAGEAPEGLRSTGDASFNGVWTLLGLPCINIPFGSGASGLPVSVQLVGHRYADTDLLARACWIAELLA